MKLNHGLATVIIGVAIAFSQPEIAVTLTAQDVGQIAKEITVLISGPKLGTGVIIHRQGNTYTVLTNFHVVDQRGTYKVQTVDDRKYQSNLITPVQSVDLAVLKFTSSEKYTVANIGNSDGVKEGATVYVAGFPKPKPASISRSTYIFTDGKITGNAAELFKDGYGLVYSNITLPGMSGGPVLNKKGQLIGVHGRGDGADGEHSKIGDKSGLNLGIPIKYFTTSEVGKNLGIITPTGLPPNAVRPLPFPGDEYFKDIPCPGRRC
ncbi:serine protease [Trichormus sp. NMC-1]|uniref:S1 family peptidase n=1 Tax=Trichormus sp. NMC-1 TaxID=1853259 RepID=UPI0008DC12C7|nr:serine protease [Trichormus sp. NMC-1]